MIEPLDMEATPIVGPWQLPRGWKWIPLREIINLNYGNALPAKARKSEGLYHVFGSGGQIGMHNAAITNSPVIIVGRKGSIGAIFYSEESCWPIDTTYYIDQFASFVNPKYIYFFLKILPFINKGAAVPGLNREDVYSLVAPIPFPNNHIRSLDIQHRIVDRIGSLLADLREAQDTLESMRQDIDQVMDGVLLEVFHEAATRNWSSKLPLGQLVDILARQVDPRLPSYKHLPHIGGENIESKTCRLGAFHTAEEDQITSSNYLFDPGVILYSKIRPYLRKVAFVDFRGLCSADIYPLSVISDKLLPRFLVWSLVAPPFTEFAKAKSGRARMPKINRSELFSYELPFPDKTEQQYIVNYLDSIQEGVDELQNMAKEDAEILQQVEQGILNQAFRGEL